MYRKRMLMDRSAVCALLVAGFAAVLIPSPATATEPLRARRNIIGSHNLKDGGVEFRVGMDWTVNMSGAGGWVFDWIHDYAPTTIPYWFEEAIKRDLVPCCRVQNCAGEGCTPSASYAGNAAGQICNWKLDNPEYADRMVYMQLWNEPSDPRDKVEPDVFAGYMVAAHAAVHNAEDAAAQQNSDIAGTFKTMTPGQNGPEFWQAVFEANGNAVNAFDVWGTHPYPESYPPHYNAHEGHGNFVTRHKMIDGYLRDLDKVAEWGRRGFRVMITETAYGDHLGISYEGYPKTTREMAADYNVAAFGTWWYQWPEIIAVHPFILHNYSWEAFAWVHGPSGWVDVDPEDGIYEPTAPYPQYTALRNWRIAAEAAGELAPARLTAYRGNVGWISGTVTRSDTGEPVKYANVYTDGYEFGGPTLYDGKYVVREVPVGTYNLAVHKRGYVGETTEITVYNNQETVTNFSLIYTGKVPKGIYFVDCGAPGLECDGYCTGCSLYATFHGQTFKTPADVGFIKWAAAKPNVDQITLKFTIIEGDNPNGEVLGSWNSAYVESALAGEMIGGEAPGDGIAVDPSTTYFLKVERTDQQGVYLYTSDSNPYPDGCRWVGNTQRTGWDLYAAIRGNTVEVSTATGTIAGWVKDESSDPIVGATVTTSPGGFSATTNGSGNYTISDVPVELYNVMASKSGYMTETEYDVSVTENQTTTVNLTLEEGPTVGTISGWVRDEQSAGISGATVQTTTGGYSTTTDGSGNYTLTNVTPDTYIVQASKTGYLTEQESGVLVVAGETTTVNLTLPAEASWSGLSNKNFEGGYFDDPDADHRTANSWHQYTLSGFSKSGVTWLGGGAHSANYVQDFWESNWVSGIYQQATGATVSNRYEASVWVKGSSGDAKFWVGIDPTGGTDASSESIIWSDQEIPGTTWTEIDVQATATSSTITMFVKAENPVAGSRNGYIDDADLQSLGATQTGTIAGHVKDESNDPLEGVVVSTDPTGFSGTTDSSGDYTISNVVVGTYDVTAYLAGYDPETDEDVTVTQGNTSTVNFTLSESAAPDTGSIEGVVTDTEEYAISGATVTATDLEGGQRETTTDGQGEYSFADVPVGTYTVAAEAAGYARSTEVTVQVASNEATEVNLVCEDAATFDGLDNGDFEDGFHNDPDVDHKTADDWSRFIVSGSPKHGGHYSTTENHSPVWCQAFWESNWTAGIYQQVAGTQQGTNYTASVWVKASNGDPKFWIGIDPDGGTDPNQAQWTTNPVVPGTTWTKISKQVQAGGTTITVFLKAQNPVGANRNAFFDDAAVTTP